MPKKVTYYIMYKYPYSPWEEYDHTQVPGWRDTQLTRCQIEHEKNGATVEVWKGKKNV